MRVANCVWWVESLKILFCELPVTFYELKVEDDELTSCKVAFCKLNIYDANFTNYHHMVESDFKGINFRKLYENANKIIQ